jgi:hypothetical protein
MVGLWSVLGWMGKMILGRMFWFGCGRGVLLFLMWRFVLLLIVIKCSNFVVIFYKGFLFITFNFRNLDDLMSDY